MQLRLASDSDDLTLAAPPHGPPPPAIDIRDTASASRWARLRRAVAARLTRTALPLPLVFVLTAGSAVGAVTGFALLYEAQSMQAAARRDAEVLASQLAPLAAERVETRRTDLLAHDVTLARAAFPDVTDLVVLDAAGQVLARDNSAADAGRARAGIVTFRSLEGVTVRVVARPPGLERLAPFASMLAALDLLLFILASATAAWLARRSYRPLRQLMEVVASITEDRFNQEAPPHLKDRDMQAAVEQIWTLGRSLTSGERDLAASARHLTAQNFLWQRRYGQARGLIDLMAEFNQAMGLHAVLERLSLGLSRFFAGDSVAIWIRDPQHDDLTLAVEVAGPFPQRLNPRLPWVQSALTGATGPIRGDPLERLPSMATALLDARGLAIGIVALTSTKRSHYTAEEQTFLRTVIGHAALAIQNATVYEYTEALSRIDPLTGLQNRREFDRLLIQELERSHGDQLPLSLLMIDIDHFKRINDEHGHQAGDAALQQVGQLVQLALAGRWGGAFRFGGEEFTILLNQTDKPGALAVAEKLRKTTESTDFPPQGTRLTISVGVAAFPEDAREAAQLLAGADRALYLAKNGGRNQVRAA